jgi:hypothetical protein
MVGRLRAGAFALGLIGICASPVVAQTVFSGEAFEPTERQCLEALESGTVVPLAKADAPFRAEAYVYHRGWIFLIIMQGGTISCQAWEM